MCGICGIYSYRAGAPAPDPEELRRTGEAMAARGPDGAGEWRSEDGAIALGHRRLAILDLSPAGAQPMASADGRYRIVYNGEIYNFRELRRELEQSGERFRTESDTEVLLALWAREGDRSLGRLRGMYALAIWDGVERSLTLARDPFGIKPLYYAVAGGLVRFASQVRALEAGGALSREVDPAGLAGFLLWGSVPEPWTIRRDIRALPAGHLLVVRDGGARRAATDRRRARAARTGRGRSARGERPRPPRLRRAGRGLPLRWPRLRARRRARGQEPRRAADHLHGHLRGLGEERPRRGAARPPDRRGARHAPRRAPPRPRRGRRPLAGRRRRHGPAVDRRLQHLRRRPRRPRSRHQGRPLRPRRRRAPRQLPLPSATSPAGPPGRAASARCQPLGAPGRRWREPQRLRCESYLD